MPFACHRRSCKPWSWGQRASHHLVVILSLSDGGTANFLTTSLLGWKGSIRRPLSEMERKLLEPELCCIDGIDICSRLWFEFVNPHYSLSLSEDSIINIVRGIHAPMNIKVLFAFSGGFVPKSIGKICTLHQYEFENLALLRLSQCFSLTQHISKNVKLKVNIFSVDILSVSQWFIIVIYVFFNQSVLISSLSMVTI